MDSNILILPLGKSHLRRQQECVIIQRADPKTPDSCKRVCFSDRTLFVVVRSRNSKQQATLGVYLVEQGADASGRCNWTESAQLDRATIGNAWGAGSKPVEFQLGRHQDQMFHVNNSRCK